MRFYDALQMDPAMLKPMIHNAKTAGEKRKLIAALVSRSVLVVAFATLFIVALSTLFGSENSPMAVALFCILLGTRFVDFGYCIKDSMITLAISFFLLLTAPVAASLVHPLVALPIHCASLLLILIMTTEQPMMGNAGLFGFAYIFLTGNPVTGTAFWNRCGLTVVGYLICGAILFFKHRHKNPEVRFHHISARFQMSSEKSRWQLCMALGVGLALSLGALFHLERFMWAGFAASSMLCWYSPEKNVRSVGKRASLRMAGVVVGSLLFLALYHLTPPAYQSMLGPLGGLLMGFCASFSAKTAMNCLGALTVASTLYSSGHAVILRIFDNAIGVLFGLLFFFVFQQVVERRYLSPEESVSL